ncbi:MAG: hypothetical protein Q9191_002457 [Dirinaria sp. TL-2023a]
MCKKDCFTQQHGLEDIEPAEYPKEFRHGRPRALQEGYLARPPNDPMFGYNKLADQASSAQHRDDHRSQDIETGPSSREHVILQFDGSNCPGCTGKIPKAFLSLPYIHNFHFNGVLLQAEFDIDTTESSIRHVIESAMIISGRSCKRIANGWLDLDVMLPCSDPDLTHGAMPLGVKDVTRSKRSVFSFKYDPTMIGARQLLKALEANLGSPVDLAPSRSGTQIPAHIRSMALRTVTSVSLTLPILVLAWAPLPERSIVYGAISLTLATIIQVVVAGPFYMKAFKSLFLAWTIDMDLLIVLSTSITYGFSLASFVCEILSVNPLSELYFDTSALLITFIMMGRLSSDFAFDRATKSASIRSLQPKLASTVDDDQLIDVRLLQIGDKMEVKPGSLVATDGVVRSGESEFDESLMTGEANPVGKKTGSQIIAGSKNYGSTVVVEVTRLPGANTITEIAEMVERVTASRPRIQQLADQIARWIVPMVSVVCIATLFVRFGVEIMVYRRPCGAAISNALPYAISVLVVSCPCAMAFAVPMVMVVASRVGAHHGVFLKSGEAMTSAKNVTHVVFDKTGTLTEACLKVEIEDYFTDSMSSTAALILSLTSTSNHVVSVAITRHLVGKVGDCAPVAKCRTVVGQGLESTCREDVVRIGNARWLGVENLAPVKMLLAKDFTVVCATKANRLIAAFGLTATPRAGARTVVASLVDRGISVSILSGDEPGAVRKIAADLGIHPKDVTARCTPLEKRHHVEKLMRSGKNTVLFCGDGINDAAALASASIGLHIMATTTPMWSVGNVALANPCLSGILTLIDLSRKAHRQIVFNFTWAIIYNVLAILFAAGAFIKTRLPPEYAALGEAVSVLPVIIIPWQLRWRKYA